MDPFLLLSRVQRVTIAAAVCLAAIVVSPAGVDIFGGPKATVVVLCALVVAGAEAARWTLARRVEIPRGAVSVALGLFVVGLLVATATSPVPAISIVGEYPRYSGLVGYLSYVVLFVAAARLSTTESATALLKAIVPVVVAVAGYALVQVADADPYEWSSTFEPVFSSLGNANFLAGWSAVTGILCLGLATGAAVSRAWRRLAFAAFGLAVLATVGSRSAQGPIALVAGIVVLVVMEPTLVGLRVRAVARRFDGVGRIARWSAASAAAAVALVLAASFLPRALDGLNPRDDYWRAALEMVKDEPVFGVGLDAYGQSFLAYRSASHAELFDFEIAEAAHNVPLQLFATGGLFLGLGYLAFVASTGAALLRGLRTTTGSRRRILAIVGAAWVTYQVQSLVSIDVPPLAVLHFVLAGMVVGLAGAVSVWSVTVPGRAAQVRRARRGATTIDVPSLSIVVTGLLGVVVIVAAFQVLRPVRADAAAAAAISALERGDLPGALADAERASGLAPWHADHWYLRAAALERMGRLEEALAATEEAARRQPGSSLLALFAGRLARATSDEATARRWYAAAVERDPRHVEVLAEAVAAALDRGDREQASALTEQARGVTDTDVLGALHELGSVLDASGRVEDAKQIWRVVLGIDDGDPIARARLGLSVPEEI